MIYDCFSFFNELDLLEMRLNILDPYVDFFVIIEAPWTFSGIAKPLYYEENKERFAKWRHKIIHHVVNDYPNDKELCALIKTKDYVPEGLNHYHRAFYQKESIKKALVGLKDDDICYYGDVDEIWKPQKIDDKTYKLRQLCYSYYLNNRSSEKWIGTVITKYKNIKNGCLNDMRAKPVNFLENGGWHFTNIGGAEAIRKKIESYDHQEFNNEEIKSQIEKRMKNNEDFLGRKVDYLGEKFKFWIDESELPEYILQNKDKYKKFFKDSGEIRNLSDKIVVVRIRDGLGNQMFQYALGRNIALSNGAILKMDLSWFEWQDKGNEKRKYELGCLQIKENFATDKEIKRLKRYQKRYGLLGIFYNFLFADDSIYIKWRQSSFSPDILKAKPPVYLDGHFESYKYFQEKGGAIKKEFVLKNPSVDFTNQIKSIDQNKSISVHVRRGDFLRPIDHHVVQEKSFYESGVRYIISKKNMRDPQITVFSQDKEWCQKELSEIAGFKTRIFDVPGIKNEEEMFIMSAHANNVISNSSFSWWAAYLNKNADKIVVAPQKWFKDPKVDTSDLIPETWTRI